MLMDSLYGLSIYKDIVNMLISTRYYLVMIIGLLIYVLFIGEKVCEKKREGTEEEEHLTKRILIKLVSYIRSIKITAERC